MQGLLPWTGLPACLLPCLVSEGTRLPSAIKPEQGALNNQLSLAYRKNIS